MSKKIIASAFYFFFVSVSIAQDYSQELIAHRKTYRNDFLTDKNSPLKEDDLQYLKFFDADESYRVTAEFIAMPGTLPFDMPTYSGKTKQYVKYGELHFQLKNERLKLSVYQNVALSARAEYKEYLFIPFKDETSGVETYGGGRYIDCKTSDIKEGKLLLDFNKCYNPYCAYSSGYSCPIPPDENKLPVKILAGEKSFGKETH